jgi:hypothetical protein
MTPKSSTRLALAAAAFLTALPSNAAPSGARSATDERGNVALGGHYLQLGVATNRGFGIEAKPEGFFGTSGDDGIGLGADHDGYGGGLDYAVDYFLGGAPEERWVVGFEADETMVATGAARATSTGIRSTTVRDESSGERLQARVISDVEGQGGAVRVAQLYSFTSDDKAFVTSVLIQNVGDTPISDVRYMRSIDPDPTALQGGAFDTNNTILSTFAGGGDAELVRAETRSDSDPLYQAFGSRTPILLYSTDERARVSSFGFANTDPYHPSAWDEPSAAGITVRGDTSITITFALGALQPGESATFQYLTSLDERGFEEVLSDYGDLDGELLAAVAESREEVIDEENEEDEDKGDEESEENIDEELGEEPTQEEPVIEVVEVLETVEVEVVRQVEVEVEIDEDEAVPVGSAEDMPRRLADVGSDEPSWAPVTPDGLAVGCSSVAGDDYVPALALLGLFLCSRGRRRRQA